MINVYAVAAATACAPDEAGIDGAPVELAAHRSLVAAISRHAAAPVPSREAILAHAAVCEGLLRVTDAVLPVRFGAAYNDDAGLHASLDERHDSLVAALDRVRGRVEVGVRVRWDVIEDDDPSGGSGPFESGHQYLMARVEVEHRRQALERRAEAVAADLHRDFACHALDSRMQVLATSGLVLSGAYLVERGDVDRMVAAVRTAAAQHPEVDVLCTGPWPPYNFADPEVSHA